VSTGARGSVQVMAPNGWLRLELRYLAALQAIAAAGSFGRAAEELGYTQSAVTQQIAALERLVGDPLIDRPGGPRPVALTPAGALLLGHAEAILARTRIAEAQLRALSQGRAGTLRVGTYQSVGVRVLPRAVARLAETHPDLQLDIEEESDDLNLIDRVRHGHLDVTFCVLPVADGCLATEELLEDPYRLLVEAGSTWSGMAVPLEALASMPMIGYRGCRIEQRVESYVRGLGLDLNRVAYADDNAIIQAMVAEGRGVALLTELSIDTSDPRTLGVDLDGWLPPRRVGLAWHRDQGTAPALDAFVAATRDATASHRKAVRPAA
jgi:DNA-binding transcriptional LysR family regulator